MQNFKEIYHLFPYFHEINNNVILKSEYIREYNLFVGLMNKYFGEDLLNINSINQNEKCSKITTSMKNNTANLQLKKVYFPNPEIKKITERIYKEFRFLNMDDIPNKYFKYNIPNNIPNNNSIGKISKKLNSIVYDIEQRIERNKISMDMQGRKKVCLSL